MMTPEDITRIITGMKTHCNYYKLLGLKHLSLSGSRDRHAVTGDQQSDLSSPTGQTAPPPPPSTAEPGANSKRLDTLKEEIGDCRRCNLCEKRTHIVFGEGNPVADIVFVGEAPGADEDIQARPFVGRAGQLLTKIIEAMQFNRSDVYIANIVKCRPPDNRPPEPDEIHNCLPFLQKQIEIIDPAIVVALGGVATKALLGQAAGITEIRGKFFELGNIKVMPTYHPSYLLRHQSKKKETWMDMKRVMEAHAQLVSAAGSGLHDTGADNTRNF